MDNNHTNKPNDQDRLRSYYYQRTTQLKARDKYSVLNLPHYFMISQRQKSVIRLLNSIDFDGFESKKILDIGSGNGDSITEYLHFRLQSEQIHGVDLLHDRMIYSTKRYPNINFLQGDAQSLPYKANAFDVVLQYTAFSSILDSNVKAKIANEMLRVLTKSTGHIVWYDFWLNPTNSNTRGIGKNEIRLLFPDCHIMFRRVTLAPPISRRLVRVSWSLSLLLEQIRLLNTHLLAIISPKQ